ncbi:prion-inhibition and propagation-domain-containing protein [Ilyonectria destructans]|nr:prion-inhibition and propagation-domain-containing protein [Ilyonectria destructans]
MEGCSGTNGEGGWSHALHAEQTASRTMSGSAERGYIEMPPSTSAQTHQTHRIHHVHRSHRLGGCWSHRRGRWARRPLSSCLEAVDKVQTYRSFGSDSHVLDTKFKATKVRLEEWGRRVGFEETMRSEDHHPALDNRDIFATVRDILQIINTLCDASDTSVHRTSQAMTPSDDVSLGSLRPRPHGTRRRKLAWALRGKTERTDQVELFEKLVQQLHNLVPVGAVQSTRPVHELDTRRTDKLASGLGTSSDHAWPAELQRILARIEEANRGKASSPSF